MKKVICITGRKNSNQIKIGWCYYLDPMSVNGDNDGNWFGEVYRDDEKKVYIGYLSLSHFKSAPVSTNSEEDITIEEELNDLRYLGHRG